MTHALLLFSKIIAWPALSWCVFVIVLVTIAKWSETELERVLYPDRWKNRVPYLVVGVIAGAWLYATWGVA